MRHVLGAAILACSLLASELAAQAPTAMPANGIVTNPSGRNIVVRTAPPEVTAFSYTLGDRVCSVGVGTQFRALAADSAVNGEIWYRISATSQSLRNPVGCTAGVRLDGWIVGRLKTGWAVRMTADTTASFAGAVDSLTAQVSGGVEEDEAEAGYGIWGRYLLLILGTVAGVVVLSIEKAESLNPKEWYSGLVAFEMVMLSVANVLFAAVLLESFVSHSDAGFVGEMVSAFAGPAWGFGVLGFVFSVLLLKFLSFSRG